MRDPLIFLLGVLTLLGTPGPTNTLLATSGAVSGFRKSLPLLAGELAGYLIAIALLRLILAPIFAATPALAVVIKIAVAIYLGWIAFGLWRSPRDLEAPRAPVTLLNVFVTTLLNPKALIFALTIIPMAHPQLWFYFASFSLCTVSVGSCWILAGRAIGAAAGRNAALVPRVASVALLGFAGFVLASMFG